MKDSDKDLEALLKPLKDIQPNDLELQRWTNAACREQKRRVSRPWFQAVAAGVVGFLIGWAVFGTNFLHKTDNKDLVTENNSATVEYVFTN